jgi:hypothetical protein
VDIYTLDYVDCSLFFTSFIKYYSAHMHHMITMTSNPTMLAAHKSMHIGGGITDPKTPCQYGHHYLVLIGW